MTYTANPVTAIIGAAKLEGHAVYNSAGEVVISCFGPNSESRAELEADMRNYDAGMIKNKGEA